MITTILQPAFMPWPGYLAMIRLSDFFVFYDDVQFLRWFVNRNRIKNQGKEKWLTCPVNGHRNPINKTRLCYDRNWISEHKELIRHAYRRSSNFEEGFKLVEEIYRPYTTVSELAIRSTRVFCEYLGIRTRFLLSSELGIANAGKTERLVEICASLGSSVYLTGFGSADYINQELFEERGMRMFFYKYEPTPYRQLDPPFIPYLSSLDAIMNCTKEEVKAMITAKPVLRVGNC